MGNALLPGGDDEEGGEAPGLLQSFAHMLSQTSPGAANLAVHGVKPAGLMATGGGASLPKAAATKPSITAYHGTPYDFDKFDINKLGTGEGAASYGHGLYFAENPKTAETYQKNLAKFTVKDSAGRTITPQTIDGDKYDQEAVRLMEQYGPDAKAWADRTYSNSPRWHTSVNESLDKLAKEGAQHSDAANGHLYQVSIAADPKHFLDWDRPLAEQHPELHEKLAPVIDSLHEKELDHLLQAHEARSFLQGTAPTADLEDLSNQARNVVMSYTGQDIHNVLRKQADSVWDEGPGVAARLQEAGIPGIKYFDQGSRISKAGTRNYVVFDDKLVNITHKNGLAVTPVDHDPFAVTPVDHDPFSTK